MAYSNEPEYSNKIDSAPKKILKFKFHVVSI